MKAKQTKKVVEKSSRCLKNAPDKSTMVLRKPVENNATLSTASIGKSTVVKQIKDKKAVVSISKKTNQSLAFCLKNGQGRDVAIELQQMDSEVIELMICMVYWATHGQHMSMFQPHPTKFSAKNHKCLRETLDELPKVSFMKQKLLKNTFHKYFANAPHLHEAHSLLTWIVTSHKGSLKHIPVADQTKCEKSLSGKGNLHLFKITNSPEKETSFKRAVNRSDTQASEWAYHGSAAHCWHSIIHNNLKLLPGMKHGQCYGRGIYMCKNAGIPMGYSHSAVSTWAKQTLGENDSAMLV